MLCKFIEKKLKQDKETKKDRKEEKEKEPLTTLAKNNITGQKYDFFKFRIQ